MLMQDLLHWWSVSYLWNLRQAQTRPHQSFKIARAPRGSPAEYVDSSSPVEDMRTRLEVTTISVENENTDVAWRLEREVIQR